MARLYAECPECERLTSSIDIADRSSPPGVATYFCTECSTVWSTGRDERIEIVKRRIRDVVIPTDAEPGGPALAAEQTADWFMRGRGPAN